MKPNLLTIAIPTLLISSSVNAVDISNYTDTKINLYGRVYAVSNLQGSDTTEPSARIGLDVNQQTIQDISVYARFEWDASNFDSTVVSIDNRYALVGLKSIYNGSIDYGKNDGVLKLITNYTNFSDILPGFGGEAAKYTVLGDRTSDVLTYTNKNFFEKIKGFDISAQYAQPASKKISGITEKYDSSDGAIGINAQYAILDTGLKLGFGYSRSLIHFWSTDSTNDPNESNDWSKNTVFNDDPNESTVVGIKYDTDKLYLAAIYNQTTMWFDSENAYTDKGYEFVAKYSYDLEIGRVTPSIAYVHHKVSNINTDLAKYVAIGVQYDLNKHFSVLFDYKINLLKEEVTDGEVTYSDTIGNQAAVGLIYNF